MRFIPETYKKNGYMHKLIQRIDKLALYELSNEHEIIGYEVHKIRRSVAKEGNFNGVIVKYDACEFLASNEEFGRLGWTFKTKEKALEKYNLLKSESKDVTRSMDIRESQSEYFGKP